jgi:hypothetical protein
MLTSLHSTVPINMTTNNKFVNLPMITTGKSNTSFSKRNKTMASFGGFEYIKVNSKQNINLKNTFDSLDLNPDFDEGRFKNINNNEDIIKRKQKGDKKGDEDLKQINNFNVTIMKDAKWGDETNAMNYKTVSAHQFPLNLREKKLKKDFCKIIKLILALMKRTQKTTIGFFK